MPELILVVDDEPKIVRLARDYLEKNGFRVLSASDGPSALAIARRERPNLILLDLLLPGMDGREVCRALRRESSVPIIMLTALAEESDQVAGLEIGADDYITKPFSPRALVARVRAMLRRAAGTLQTAQVLRAGALEIDNSRHRVTQNKIPVHLTPNEFKVLEILAHSPGQIFSREQLMENVYGAAVPGIDRSIDSHIKNLRRKLDPGQFIETVYGLGYRFNAQEKT